MAYRRLVPKRAPTRHELEQQLDVLAREYSVSKDTKVREQMFEVCRRMKDATRHESSIRRRCTRYG
jgi:hypothetical protein